MTADAGPVEARAMLRGLGWDVGLPLATYYGLHALGVADLPALLAATAAAGTRIAVVAVRDRALNAFATLMLVVFGLGVVLSLVSGDPRFLLLKGSITTGAVALVFLATTLRGTPLTLAATQSFRPAQREQLAQEYRTDPDVRRLYRNSSLVWGVGLLVEAAVRVPLIYLLPVSVMVGLSAALMVATFAGLIAWNVWYVRRAVARMTARTAAPGAAGAGPPAEACGAAGGCAAGLSRGRGARAGRRSSRRRAAAVRRPARRARCTCPSAPARR